ncbi:MAG: histidine kinase [Clostridia bacterium]|nr:histidine kinase [Clostridia bacterium]MBR6860332.1 histidine kinase [Acidaminococcaceae bacterium]
MYLRGTDIINLTIALIGILSCANMLLIQLVARRKDKVTLTYMVFAFIALLSYNICLCFFVLLQSIEVVVNYKVWYLTLILMGFGTYLYAIITAFVVSSYVAYLVKLPERARKGTHRALFTMLVLFLVILLIMQRTGNLVQIDETGTYSEGPYSFTGHVMVGFFLLFNLVMLIRFRGNVSLRQRCILYLYIGLPILAIVLRPFVNGIFIVALSSSLSVSLFMIFSVIEQAAEYRQQELKNEQLKIDILLGQIQPHFLFNVLYVIQEICHIDPEKASEAISEFSKYLRHNMDSLSINSPIPFSDELEHTMHYISLQQLRFGEALVVKYELACTEFYMPTLTLQPIVENAVRYGVRKTSTGEGTVIIQTSAHPDHYEVKVIDNGPGFDPNARKEDGISHTGLNNVRERLQRICDGKLEIWSELGKGTIVTMILPKKK